MISYEQYYDRVVSVHLQFDLATRAIEGFQNTPDAVKEFVNGEFESLKKIIQEHLKRTSKEVRDFWIYDEEHVSKYLNSMIGSLPGRFNEIEKRLEQNEIIIRATLLENFLKDVHREALRQVPRLLPSARQVPLGRLIALGADTVLDEEIERQVHSLDRKDVKGISDYFRDTLSIDYSCNGTIIPLLEHVISTRNKILHEDTDAEVDGFAILFAQIVGTAIPMLCAVQGAILYPKGFQAPQHSDEIIEHFKQKIQKKCTTSPEPTPANDSS